MNVFSGREPPVVVYTDCAAKMVGEGLTLARVIDAQARELCAGAVVRGLLTGRLEELHPWLPRKEQIPLVELYAAPCGNRHLKPARDRA